MSPSRTGLVISALLHAALVGLGLYFWLKPTPQPDDRKETVVPVALAAFEPTAAPKPTAPPPAQEAPASPTPASEPKPQPKPQPEPPAPLPATKPEPKLKQHSERKPTPPPKPIHHPAPQKATEPKRPLAQETPRPPSKDPSPAPAAPPDRIPTKTDESASAHSQTPTRLTSSEHDNLMMRYQSALAEAIEREKFYPSLARRLNQEGIIRVGFTVLADGSITNIHLVEPSAATALNRGAIEAIKRVGQFKPIPPALNMQSMELNISLIYKLR